MTKIEIFKMLKRNKHRRKAAIVYISDFLNIKNEEARYIYDYEFLEWLKSS